MSLPEKPDEPARVATGFNVVPPPGWDIIPLHGGTNEAMHRIVEESVSQLPTNFPKDDIPKARMQLVKELRKTIRQARESRGLTLYLPVELIHGMIIPASFIASEPIEIFPSSADTEAVLDELARDADETSKVALDDTMAMRTLQKLPAVPDRGVEAPSWRVQYIIPIPKSAPTQCLTFTFSTLIAADMDIEFTETLVELFDAVMTTFRWSYA